MSDEEEESMSEGFSASEEEWKPSKDVRGGESSDDDDSDFEESHLPAATSNNSGGTTGSGALKKREPKSRSATKQAAVKKRKPAGQSLRSKLYNKYRPPPKTFPSPSSAGSNSPSASTSRTASKNAQAPNESGEHGNDSSSDSSFEDYLVNPAELDLLSSFFSVGGAKVAEKTPSPAPIFDCNAGVANLSDSGSEDNNESSAEEHAHAKAFDFGNLLDNVNSLERAKETIAKRAAEAKTQAKSTASTHADTAAMDVKSLLALGEGQSHVKADKIRNKPDTKPKAKAIAEDVGPPKLSKTKSTRVKRHTKTRPTSTVVAGDTDDSDWEEVADDAHNRSLGEHTTPQSSGAGHNETLEIRVELPSRHRTKQQKQQQDIELALRRRLNRDLKERQLALHKVSLLCHFARSYNYNRLLNDTALMQAALKLLPSQNAYPPEQGTEIKYYQSLVTWFKTAVKLNAPDLYPEKSAKRKRRIKVELLEQIRRKEACCKQDMTFMFVALLRGMGLQCRLVVNMQPMPIRPAQADLLTIKLKRDSDQTANDGGAKKAKLEGEQVKVEEIDVKVKSSTAKSAAANANAGKDATEEEGTAKKVDKGKSKDKESAAAKLAKLKASEERKEEAVAASRSKSAKGQLLKSIEKEKNIDTKRDGDKKSEATQVEQQSRNTSTGDTRKNTSEKVVLAGEANPAGVRAGSHNEKSVQLAQGELKENKQNSNRKTAKQTILSTVAKESEEPGKNAVAAQSTTKSAADKTEQYASIEPKGPGAKPMLSKLRLKQQTSAENSARNTSASAEDERPSLSVGQTPIARRTRQAVTDKLLKHAVAANSSQKPVIQIGSPVVPKLVTRGGKTVSTAATTESVRENAASGQLRETRSRSKSPRLQISPSFLQTKSYKEQFLSDLPPEKTKNKRAAAKSPSDKVKISPTFLQQPGAARVDVVSTRVLRSRQKSNEVANTAQSAGAPGAGAIPQLDGADDVPAEKSQPRRPQLKKTQKPRSLEESDDDFQPSSSKRPKKAPKIPPPKSAADRRVLSTDDDEAAGNGGEKGAKRKSTAVDIWVEVWSDMEEQWVCVDLFKAKIHSVESIRKAATPNFAYVFAFQNDLSVKDVTARYCPNWTTTVRKSRVDRAWLEMAISRYYGLRTLRDVKEDQELRRIHEEKPMPTTISEYKDHPLYALERHLLKFQAIYPPNAPTLGFVRGEPVYSRDCVHTLHSREIWLKQARTVKLGEQPYKIVKARPKWDRLTQTVIKDQPLEIFGYWQTEDYEPPTAENGIVPRNAYGNVELFKKCMLPKKTVHLKLSGLNRICKKLGIDCANAVIGFDFHQGACHPLFDGFVVCEEFADQVTAAWYQDQEEQERKEQEKYETRVYGNWRKLIRGLLIRERLKKKYNF